MATGLLSGDQTDVGLLIAGTAAAQLLQASADMSNAISFFLWQRTTIQANPEPKIYAESSICLKDCNEHEIQSKPDRSSKKIGLSMHRAEAVQLVIVGAASRTLAQLVVHPLDTLKTRLQVASPNNQLQAFISTAFRSGHRVPILSRFVTIPNWLAFGPADLYRGSCSIMVGMMPTAAAYFTADLACKHVLRDWVQEPRFEGAVRLVSSALAAVTSTVFRVPMDVVKHRVQAYTYSSSATAARQILKTQGVKGLYTGLGATLMRDAPEVAIQFAVYEELRARSKKWFAHGQGQENSCLTHMMLGAASGMVSALLTTPLDVLKTQMQAGNASSLASAAKSIMLGRGAAGFFAGVGPRVMIASTNTAIFFTLYELGKAHCAQMSSKQRKSLAMRKTLTSGSMGGLLTDLPNTLCQSLPNPYPRYQDITHAARPLCLASINHLPLVYQDSALWPSQSLKGAL